MDDLVDGYSQFTALADEASKGLAVDGVRDPLGRTTTSHIPPTAASQHAASPFSSPSSRRLPSSAPSQPLFGSGGGSGGDGAPAPIPAFASAAVATGTERAGKGEALRADPVQDPVARDALKLLFSKEGNYVQVRVYWAERGVVVDGRGELGGGVYCSRQVFFQVCLLVCLNCPTVGRHIY